jgi:Putative lumazine-binding
MNNQTALLRIVKRYIKEVLRASLSGYYHIRHSIPWYSQLAKSILLLFMLLVTSVSGFSQQSVQKDKDLVLEKVNQFFEALEKQDTNLFKSITLPGGQTWSVKEVGDSVRVSMRSFEDRIRKFINPAEVIQERALDVEIKIHRQVAMAWVPYELDLSGQFLHCGVDIFTMLKTNQGWKITTVAFTMEPNGCDDIKKSINKKK